MKLTIACLLFASTAAHAAVQCNNAEVQLQMSLALPSGPLGDGQAPFVFGAAECQCRSTDATLKIEVQRAIPLAKANGQLQVWVGQGCDQAANRTVNSTLCRLVGSNLSYNQFVEGVATAMPIDLQIATADLFPNGCDPSVRSDNVYLLFAPNGDTTNADACSFPLTESTKPPVAAQLTATAEGGAATLRWTASVDPTLTYQVLCARGDGSSIGRQVVDQAYSVCNDGQLARRGAVAMSSARLDQLGSRYLCSEPMTADSPGAAMQLRIDGLDAQATYQFTLVAVDAWGNASPSGVVALTTPPALANDVASSGCAVAGPYGSAAPLAMLLLALLALSCRRPSARRKSTR